MVFKQTYFGLCGCDYTECLVVSGDDTGILLTGRINTTWGAGVR